MSAPDVSSLPGLSDTRLEEIEQQWAQYTPTPADELRASGWDEGKHERAGNEPPDAQVIRRERCVAQSLEIEQTVRDLLAEVRRLQGAIRQHEEDEASVCPEDVGFVEYIRALESQLASAREETAQLRDELKIATTPDIYGIEDTIVDADDLYSLDLGVGDVAQVWANRVLGNRWVACLALPDSDDYECAVFDTEAEARAAVRSRSLPGETADA